MPDNKENIIKVMAEKTPNRSDIVLAIKLLFDLVPKEQRRTLPLDNLDLRGLIFNKRQDLSFAFFNDAKFEGATMDLVDLQNSFLGRANFHRVSLEEANLSGSVLASAVLSEAFLWNVKFENTIMWGADFSNAYLMHAQLNGSEMGGAKLLGTDITDTSFLNVQGLTQDQLNEAIYDHRRPPKDLPEGLVLSRERAFDWVKQEKKCRQFVHNKEWIDEETPWWWNKPGAYLI